jgi:hypothetical protein
MEAINAQAVDEAMDLSRSLARRRQRPSDANVRSATQRRGKSSKPLAVSDRLGHATFDDYGLLTSLPSHHGYKQLSIILQKPGGVNEALALCQQAKEQGWQGDWENRIARLQSQLKKR